MMARRPPVSTPLRLTGVLIAVFMAVLLISFAVSFLVIRNNFDDGLRDQIETRAAAYREISSTAELLDRLTEELPTVDPATVLLDYRPTSGPRLSNVDHMPAVTGVTIIPEGAAKGKDVDDSYLAESFAVAGGRLTVALSRAPLVDMGEVFLAVLVISLLPTLIVSAGVGLFFARKAKQRIAAISTTLQLFERGNMTARVAVNPIDRDDLAEIATAVNHMAIAQEAAMAGLKQATTDIAHDLKTPIQRVAATLDRLQNRTPLSGEQAGYVAQAVEETDRIAKTFEALLRIAQIEGGAVRDRFEPVDLGRLAADFVDVFDASAEESGHQLQLHAEPDCIVSGDRDLLGQVLANLIENSLRHVPTGGDISVSVAKSTKGVVLQVADSGPGIPAAERGRVLRRLYRLESSRSTPGNGLGLSMVAAIGELHGVVLTLSDNTPGLIVSMQFPISR
jgi:signal transduction histidine kinase